MSNFPDTVSTAKCTCCLSRNSSAICFLAFLLALAVGLVFGVFYAEPLLPAIAAIIAFIAAIAAIIIALLIYRLRRCD